MKVAVTRTLIKTATETKVKQRLLGGAILSPVYESDKSPTKDSGPQVTNRNADPFLLPPTFTDGSLLCHFAADNA